MRSKVDKTQAFGEAEYRTGARARLEDAEALLDQGRLGGSIYLAGRAVEGMLRAVIWRGDVAIRLGRKALDSGHDLRELLALARGTGLLRAEAADERLEASVQYLARLWFNNMRFASTKYVERRWRTIGVLGKRVTLKQAATAFVATCSVVIGQCEVLCER